MDAHIRQQRGVCLVSSTGSLHGTFKARYYAAVTGDRSLALLTICMNEYFQDLFMSMHGRQVKRRVTLQCQGNAMKYHINGIVPGKGEENNQQSEALLNKLNGVYNPCHQTIFQGGLNCDIDAQLHIHQANSSTKRHLKPDLIPLD